MIIGYKFVMAKFAVALAFHHSTAVLAGFSGLRNKSDIVLKRWSPCENF